MSKFYNDFIFQVLILLVFMLLIVILYKRFANKNKGAEGFQQSERFVLKQGDEIYDEFYSEIYDELMKTKDRTTYEIDTIIELVTPNKETSRFLDIGCGTGNTVNLLKEYGYNAYGIDKSEAMVKTAEKLNPNISIKTQDVLDPMAYERTIFTHVLCLNFTFYEIKIEDRLQFFQNCYFWIRGNGYLFLHLVDPDKFDSITPAGKPPIDSLTNGNTNSRITDTFIDFIDFTYKSSYDFKPDKKTVVHKETFKDIKTNNVRENEKTIILEPMNDILKYAMKAGFVVKGKWSYLESCLKDENQFLYILERTL